MLAIALIPSVVLVLVGVALAGYLITDAVKARDYANKIRSSEGPGIPFILAAEQERRLTMSVIAGQGAVRATLLAARPKTDEAADRISAVLQGNFADDSTVPASVKQNISTFAALYAKIHELRRQVDAGQVPLLQAFDFYNRIIDQFTQGVAGLAQAARGAENAFARLSAIPIFNAAEQMQRSDALSTAGLAAGGLAGDQLRAYLGEVGAYHAELEQSVPQLIPPVRASYDKLVASPEWKTVNQVEAAFLTGGANPRLPVSPEQWRTAAHQVAATMMTLFTTQSANATDAAIDDADRTLADSIIAGVVAILVAIAVVLVALRLSRRFISRLARLREDTLDAAEVRLPELMERVRAGQPVDLEAGGHLLDHGADEIGQVADAFNTAQSAAIAAAVEEARTREGTKAVFLNIAHRSQVIVHRQLKVLDQAERKQEDPDQLDTLFQLDHLSTRARRNAENLIILGGGQPGRRWRQPGGLAERVRGAAAETEDFARVKTTALPPVAVRGPVVGDLVHLLAELIDNATSFSPPTARVELRGNVVGRGVVIEVEDQGLGLEDEQAGELNRMLADPPDFSVMALSDEPRLGLFVVARLASRHGISVHLRESAYGGTRAIVLVRSALLAPAGEVTPDEAPAADSAAGPSVDAVPVAAGPVVDQRGPVADFTRVGRRSRHRAAPVDPAVAEPSPEPSPVRPPRPPQPAWPAQEPRTAPENGRPQQPRRPEAPGRPPLPQRRRQQNLVPQLRADRAEPEREAVREDSADAARDRLAAFQRGTRQARVADAGSFDTTYGDQGR
ncbi:nitrate- and nitrite sensing domain-containing protein [Amycolatopsis sp. PS_44_ISF1]|uniref:sensor histidine kinase n=1 Tax=Amycolatopsis sp. PS_44_ISF1 TaxID=2974917 RepID=UPI0028E02DD9|nr:nitrate- and nitrite sensing domain-containing protein [Amycolatopsis sp. PS_44_ISF1]MDT8911752.1 nitrate- and nitrite sensing domain-containing protein [Amycolatopsis sp. PS_44_ISF1]